MKAEEWLQKQDEYMGFPKKRAKDFKYQMTPEIFKGMLNEFARIKCEEMKELAPTFGEFEVPIPEDLQS